MAMTEAQIRQITEEIVRRLAGTASAPAPAPASGGSTGRWLCDTAEEAIANAKAAQLEAEGEAEYMRMLAEAYDTPDKKDFYEFTLGLDALKSSLKTAIRKFREAAEAGNVEQAVVLQRAAARQLDKAVSKGVIHKNQAANRKSAIAKRLNQLQNA